MFSLLPSLISSRFPLEHGRTLSSLSDVDLKWELVHSPHLESKERGMRPPPQAEKGSRCSLRKGSMSSNTTETKEDKKGPPQIVKLNKALALAEKWVSNMSKLLADDESFEAQSRPARLGLGAKVSCTSTFVPSDDPLERKLYYKLNAQKRNAAKIAEDLAPGAGDDDDEDNEDSRTSAFKKKKRAGNPLTPPLGKKKRRK